MSHEVGLLFGNVQSGKTGQMFGVISKAADLGFSVFLLLTTDNIVLQQQTIDRVKAICLITVSAGKMTTLFFSRMN